MQPIATLTKRSRIGGHNEGAPKSRFAYVANQLCRRFACWGGNTSSLMKRGKNTYLERNV